jgi:hypothetical protein
MNLRSIAMLLALAGCAAVQQAVQPGAGVVDAIVAEAVAAARAPAAEQAAALARAQQAFSSGAPADRLRLATLLATLPAPLRDDARATELLEPLADAAAPGVGRFAALLSSQITERQRVVRELERVSREAERAARDRERSDKERDKREEALRQQFEALRAIERGILEREEKLRRRQR